MSTQAMLRINNAEKCFGKGTANAHHALNGLSLSVEAGEFVTVLGSNGAGKSTLFNAICGSFFLDEGSIYLGGEDISFMPEYKRSLRIGRLFQDPMKGTAPSLTIEENLALSYTKQKKKSFSIALGKAERELFRERLAAFGMDLENRMQTKIGLLSGGQRQVVTLLMATIVPPKLLLLDEHTAALDPGTAEKVMEVTREIVGAHRITTLMITHNMQQALAEGSRTIMLSGGRILLDIGQKERAGLTVSDLVRLYADKNAEALMSDRMLLA